jgi:murein DD-endopeptidase MepM/ murein hydrolase activator NlpD
MQSENKSLLAIGFGAFAIIALSFKKPRPAAAATLNIFEPPTVGPSNIVRGIVQNGRVTSPYGDIRNDHVHQGIDIAAAEGEPIRAALAGIVADIASDGSRSGYGNTVMLQHTDGTVTLYAHMKGFAPGLHVGQVVGTGQVIGYVGRTHAPETNVMFPHVHFEVHRYAQPDARGRLIVNREGPPRWEPTSWLAQYGRLPADTLA